ncbi:MAG: TIGR00296 family protein [Candidatus Diapherotrites archaeon]
MPQKYSLKQGEQLVKLARKSIAYYLHTGSALKDQAPEEFREKRGLFTTIHSFPSMELRGCIGFPFPVMPLWNAVIESAVSAAFSDPRFHPLEAKELNSIIVELSILTQPEEIKEEKGKIAGSLRKGTDGLIVRKGNNSGLLLPQVWPELDCRAEEFLAHTCMKAWLPENSWKDKDCKVLKFQCQIFKEKKPEGKVNEEK